MKHRKFGGSTAARTLACPGWPQQSEGVPREAGGPSPYAQEGSALHDIMEALVLYEGDDHKAYAFKAVGTYMHDTLITEDHIVERILPAWEAYVELCHKYDLEDVEPEVECSYADDVGGYADLMAVSGDGRTVVVMDWKFGMGNQVFPEDLAQGLFYAVTGRKSSSVTEFFNDNQRVVLAVIQPNDRDLDTLRTWETDTARLDDFEDELNNALTLARKKDAPLKSGDHCKWCPAAPMCPQKTGLARMAMLMQPDDLETLGQSMTMVQELKDWIKQVEAATYDQLTMGAPVKGWKLVAKHGRKKWNNPERAMKSLARKLGGTANITNSTLKSPAQIIKLAKARGECIDYHIKTFVEVSSSGNTLAPEDDKRPAVFNADNLQAALDAIS
jgi:hypothetical protein